MFRSWFNKYRKNIKQENEYHDTNNSSLNVSKDLKINLAYINNLLDEPEDLNIRELKLGKRKIPCAIIHMEGIVNSLNVNLAIMNNLEQAEDLPSKADELFAYIYDKLIAVNNVHKSSNFDDITLELISGYTVIYVDGVDTAILVETIGGEIRAIEEPITETLIRGPRDGFVENIQTNLALIRRNIKDHNLRFKAHRVGERSQRQLIVTYLDGVANPLLVKEVKRRLESIDTDIVLESGYIEAWIEDSFLSPFPQMLNTERPDRVVNALNQGKVAILLDRTPFVIIAPMTFVNVLQSPQDYYDRWMVGSLLRILRYFGGFISLFLPALYIALISVQPDMLPSDLAFSISGTREGVPFPPVIEAFMMIITMELLQEAGARLPQTIGQTIGIVGGLVIGEAAVQAGIVSPVMVIVVALTAIANFTVPSFNTAIGFRIIRLGFMLSAAAFGLFGIILAYIMMNIHAVNLTSFGIPYSTPFAPFFKKDWNDVVLRFPIQTFDKRPEYMLTEDEDSLRDEGEQK